MITKTYLTFLILLKESSTLNSDFWNYDLQKWILSITLIL